MYARLKKKKKETPACKVTRSGGKRSKGSRLAGLGRAPFPGSPHPALQSGDKSGEEVVCGRLSEGCSQGSALSAGAPGVCCEYGNDKHTSA